MKLLPQGGEGSVPSVPYVTRRYASILDWLDQSLLFTGRELLNTTLRGLSVMAPASCTVLSNRVSLGSAVSSLRWSWPFRVWGPRCWMAPPIVGGGRCLLFGHSPGVLPGASLPLNRRPQSTGFQLVRKGARVSSDLFPFANFRVEPVERGGCGD